MIAQQQGLPHAQRRINPRHRTRCLLAQSVSRQVRVSGIVLSLTGALLEPEAAHDPRTLGVGLFSIVDFGIAIILFEGGLNLQWSRLKRQEAAIRRLITGGALITLVGATVLARFAVGWQWDLSLLFGSLESDRSDGRRAAAARHAPESASQDRARTGRGVSVKD